jgi:hypothetical protein
MRRVGEIVESYGPTKLKLSQLLTQVLEQRRIAQGHMKLSEKGLLTPDNWVVTLIDLQPQMPFGVSNFDRQSVINNNLVLANAVKVFGVPAVLSTVETKAFSSNMWPQIQAVFPKREPKPCSQKRARRAQAPRLRGRGCAIRSGAWPWRQLRPTFKVAVLARSSRIGRDKVPAQWISSNKLIRWPSRGGGRVRWE